MSERAGNTSEFRELWGSVSKLCHSEMQDGNKTGVRVSTDPQSPLHKDLQSPQHKGYSKLLSLNNGDSPGDVEPSQDIFWDPTSPTPANAGPRNTRVLEISDIVNRIAPRDVKPKGTESPLLQWIGDSAVPCTPDVPKPRTRKRSSRQSSVEDLMKLARQFDKNMQQDKEISEQLNPVNNNPTEPEDTSEAKLVETSLSANAKDSKCLSSSDQAEAELHALFDCSTQKVSGRLSQGSSCSQEVKKQPETSALAEPRQSEQKMSDKSDPSQPARAKGPPGVRGDFDDDWENDDLLNDSFVLAITQNPDQLLDTNAKTRLSDTKANTPQFPSVTNSGHQLPNMHSKPSCSEIQELCPKLKTTNRSTFKLQPNPHFQPKTAAKGDPKSNLTALHSKSKISEEKSVSSKVPTNAQPAKVSNDHKTYPAVSSVRDNPDSLWDDGDDDDDALLFQICDSVERISNSQPQQVCSSISPKKQESGLDSQRKTSAPLPIDATRSSNTGASAYKKSPCSFVRSNSLPGTSCQAGNYQGLNIPLKGANNKSGMSQSLPGSRMSLGTFINRSDSAATFQGGNDNLDLMPHTVKARTPQTSKSCHTAFKRNVSDTAVIKNKVFVTSQMRGKCSAAEIERKKQEALARRKQRMQSTQKP